MAAGKNRMRVAAIDLGSNSFHMLVVEVLGSGSFETVLAEKMMIQLGKKALVSGRLDPETMERGLQCPDEFRRMALARRVERTIVVATSAIREAENGKEFLHRAAARSGVSVRVISGQEEARLVHLAVSRHIDLNKGGSMQAETVKIKVLFLCTGNSCRSQMAEGWTRRLKGAVIEPYSAGVDPRALDGRAVAVMAEAGIDISGQRSKHVDEMRGITFDYVVTVCDQANESCPVFPGDVKRVHVDFDDPPKLAANANTEKEALEHYRRVRDQIRAFVEKLPGALVQQMLP